MRLILYTDGASRGNPGPASAAYVLCDPGDRRLKEEARRLGETTNNVAEYTALVMGLEAAAAMAPGGELECRMDSELVAKQMKGIYQVKAGHLAVLHARAKALARKFERTVFTHVPRNSGVVARADRLCNEALDEER